MATHCMFKFKYTIMHKLMINSNKFVVIYRRIEGVAIDTMKIILQTLGNGEKQLPEKPFSHQLADC